MGFCTTVNKTSAELASLTTQSADNKTLVNDIRAALKGNYMVSKPGLAIGSTTTAVSSVAFTFTIGGVQYSKAAVAAGTAPGNDVVPQSKFGAVAFDIGTDGTIDAVEAPANATGYNTAALAAAALPAAATGHARLGYVTASKSDGAFTFGTTDLNAANTTVAYTDGSTNFEAIGAAVAS